MGINRYRSFGVRYWILGIVHDHEATGAMMMNKMEEMSWGHWRPSPGNIYPLLGEMVKAGLLRVKLKGGKKFYLATEKGKEQLDNSWFPWKEIRSKYMGFGGVKEAVEKLENYSDYVIDNSTEVKKSKDSLKRIDAVARKLNMMGKGSR